jgi:hypothetical protein
MNGESEINNTTDMGGYEYALWFAFPSIAALNGNEDVLLNSLLFTFRDAICPDILRTSLLTDLPVSVMSIYSRKELNGITKLTAVVVIVDYTITMVDRQMV